MNFKNANSWGQPCGRVVRFARSATAAQGFSDSDPGCGHGTTRSSGHDEAASHVLQLEGPITKVYNYVLGEIWGENAGKKKRIGNSC